jgi:hypothetical protein
MGSIDKLKKLGDGLDKIGAECKKAKKLTPKECYFFKEKKIPAPTGEKLKRYEERIKAWKTKKASKGKK